MGRLQEKYKKEVLPKLKKEFQLANDLSVPKLVKIVVNMGIGDASRNKERFEQAKVDIASITGQMPQLRRANVSVASFGVRKGMPVGLKTTLRSGRMYDFFDKLVSIVLPRLRDFRGVSLKSFDGSGSYSIGIPEHSVFPEIDLAKTGMKSLEVVIVTTAKDKKETKRLLEELGMPFEKRQ